jgi:predicted ATPase
LARLLCIPRSNLPASLTLLIGREKEIALVHEYLVNSDIRVVTLTGPPGIGKTRLGVEVARTVLPNFPDGIFFVALAPVEDASLVASTIAQTVGFVEMRNQSSLEQLKDGIGDKQMLIVLDNIEHLIEETATLASALLSACPRLRILTTSREALRVLGEWLYHVPALKMPVAGQLQSLAVEELSQYTALTFFAERARAVKSDFVLNAENIESVANICTQLDGLPLAIELIAARIRLMSPQALFERLSAQFTLYADGVRAVSARQKTLHNAIRWSYNLLSPEEQTLFARLSVFAGGFTLEAAAQVTEYPDVLNGITALMDKSLLQRAFDQRDETRFTMLFTIREFALDLLDAMNETVKLRDQHLKYFLNLAEQAEKEIHGPHQIEWLDHLEAEHGNYRAALDWCVTNGHTESALHLIGAFCGPGCRLWSIRGYFSEARNWFDRVRRLPDISQYPLTYAVALNGMSFLNALHGDFPFARSLAEESQRICDGLGSEGELVLAGALTAHGLTELWSSGNRAQVEICFEQAARIYQARGNRWEQAMAIFRLGMIARDVDKQVMGYFEDSLATFKEYDDAFGLARVYEGLGIIYYHQDNPHLARNMHEQALIYNRRIRFWAGLCTTLNHLGAICRIQNDYDQANTYLEEALSIEREFNIRGDFSTYYYLGCVMLNWENYSEAGKYFFDYLRNSLKVEVKINIGESFLGLAAVAAGLHQHERAVRLSSAGQALHDTVGWKMLSYDRIEIDPLLHIARAQLGEARFESIQAEGRALTTEQAIAYALGQTDQESLD